MVSLGDSVEGLSAFLKKQVRDSVQGANAFVWRQLNRTGPEWHRLPGPTAALNLIGLREEIRRSNLHDTGDTLFESAEPADDLQAFRTYDGSDQDPYDPEMGMAGTRLGRNMPIESTRGESEATLLSPSPREVSRQLLLRDTFTPATTLNVLAAAWIQFQNHGWFGHGDNAKETIEIPLVTGDDWDLDPMQVRRANPDRTQVDNDGNPATYINKVTHWWDGSQIYGSSEKAHRQLRAGELGKLAVEDGMVPRKQIRGLRGMDLTGFNDSYWVGLSLLHTLFVKEHNAICGHLHKAYPSWDDEKLFLTARLVNAALMAKIHTVEWTPGILNHPVLATGMYANWYGALPAWAKRTRRLSRTLHCDALGGIVGGAIDHHAAPFSISEDFASATRLSGSSS